MTPWDLIPEIVTKATSSAAESTLLKVFAEDIERLHKLFEGVNCKEFDFSVGAGNPKGELTVAT